MKRFTRILIVLILILGSMQSVIVTASPAPTYSTLWEQLPNGQGASLSVIGSAILADDFVLENASSIAGIEIWSNEVGPFNLHFDIYRDTVVGGYDVPGVLVESMEVSSSNGSEDSICAQNDDTWYYCKYRHTLSLDVPLDLESGHYWLAVYGSGFGWSQANIPSQLTTFAIKFSGSPWDGQYSVYAFAFRLIGPPDTTAPVVNVPEDMTVPATSASGTVVTFAASATDNVDGTLTPTCAPASGSTFPIGQTTVTCTATDAALNQDSASFKVTVSDQTDPVVTVPNDMTVPATSASGAVVNFQASATDNVDDPIAPTCDPASGSTFPKGQTMVTCTATDVALNQGSASFNVTVRDPMTLIVNSTDDVVDGACNATHCSLREAVNTGINGDTIIFDLETPATITLTSRINIDKSLTIIGLGADQLAISGGEVSQIGEGGVFFIRGSFGEGGAQSIQVSISALTIKDGRANYGGGILNGINSTLEMSDCVIGPNNIVTDAGGGLANRYGVVSLNRCTIVDNHGTGSIGGAGLYTADGGSLTLINSTVKGNVTNNFGGGIYIGDKGLVNLVHTTISGNTANQNYLTEAWGGGGGVYVLNTGTITIQNSIVAGNTDLTNPTTAGHAKWPDVYGAFTSQTGNLIGDGTGATGLLSGLGDMVGSAGEPLDPALGSFGVYTPGKTPLFPLLPQSIAIDAVYCPGSVTIDQRGVSRPQGSSCDIGAFEVVQEPDNYLIFLPIIQR